MADAPKTIPVAIPEGMTPERLIELVASYEKRRVANKARQDGRKQADKALREAHKDEYAALVKKFAPKA
jgi:hypothetical protein